MGPPASSESLEERLNRAFQPFSSHIRQPRTVLRNGAAVIAVFALVGLAAVGCSSGDAQRPSSEDQRPSGAGVAASPSGSFPTAAFADVSEDPVSEEVAAKFQAALDDMAGGAGMAATVMSPAGTWSGATGKADGVRDVEVNDQFAIGSVTKSVIAAQVMQMVEAGELDLDDPATDHLPPTSTSIPMGRQSASCWATAAASLTITLGYWRACQPNVRGSTPHCGA